jgi:hypothetical protein
MLPGFAQPLLAAFPNDYFSFKRLWLVVVVVLPGTQHVLDINMATGINKNRK